MSGMTFLEVGPGSGHLTQILLDEGMSGSVIELSTTACDQLADRFSNSISQGSLVIRNESFLSAVSLTAKFDLVVSAMVLEHLDSSEEKAFVQKCHDSLKTNGVLILFVPANPNYWGIEDEVAGHFRRYTLQSLVNLVKDFNFSVELAHGLTWPLSNILLPLSNLFVKRSEYSNLELEKKERTLLSGHRDVMFKTVFPRSFRFILNKVTLYPFYLAQSIFKNNPNSLVIYLRAKKFS